MTYIPNDRPLRFREPREKDRAYLGWVKERHCVCCAWEGRSTFGCDAAHVKIGFPEADWRAFGHSEKSHDRRAVPMCRAHHSLQHANKLGDERAFWEHFGIYPPTFCDALYGAYLEGMSGNQIVRKAAHGDFPFPT